MCRHNTHVHAIIKRNVILSTFKAPLPYFSMVCIIYINISLSPYVVGLAKPRNKWQCFPLESDWVQYLFVKDATSNIFSTYLKFWRTFAFWWKLFEERRCWGMVCVGLVLEKTDVFMCTWHLVFHDNIPRLWKIAFTIWGQNILKMTVPRELLRIYQMRKLLFINKNSRIFSFISYLMY